MPNYGGAEVAEKFGFGLKQLFHHEDHSAAGPQPKNLGIGELTTKGAKNAKEEIGLSRAKHVLSNVEGTLSSFDFLCALCITIQKLRPTCLS
jgi:hypothetical protein